MESLEALFLYATEGIIISDRTGTITRVNPAAEKLFGYNSGELNGKKIEILIPKRFTNHTELRDSFHKNPHARQMGSGMVLNALRKNGTEFPVEISLSYFKIEEQQFVISFVIDISERVENEKKLQEYAHELERVVNERTQSLSDTVERLKKQIRENEETQAELDYSRSIFSTVASNYPIGSINVIDKNFNYVFTGGMSLRKQNLNAAELIGKSVFPSIKDHYRNNLLKNLQKVFNGEKITDQEFPFNPEGEIYNYDAFPLYNLEGNIDNIAVFTKNVTEKKRAEKELQLSLEKERELNHLKTRFVSIASHEFRTPLSAIKLSASLIEKYVHANDRENPIKHAGKIKTSVDHLTNILNEFLSADKLEEGKVINNPVSIDLEELCKKIIDELQSLIKPGQKMQCLHKGSTKIFADANLLWGCVINLAGNAVKYSGENTSIVLQSTTHDKYCEIKVSDNGIGIPRDAQRHLFEPFFRAHNTGNIPGTGLGLNIVKKYVSIMNGEIDFVSKENEGTSFRIKIPIYHE